MDYVDPLQKNIIFWTWGALIISFVSIALTLTSAILGMVISFESASVAVLSYALESMVDIISSFFVVWRFWLQTKPDADLKLLESREDRANVAISFLFLIISTIIGVQSIEQFVFYEAVDETTTLLILSSVSIVAYIGCGAVKIYISRKLNSTALREDGICTSASAVLSLGIVVSSAVYAKNPAVWYLDPIVALMVAVFLLVWGVKGLYTARVMQWWTLAFWKGEMERL